MSLLRALRSGVLVVLVIAYTPTSGAEWKPSVRIDATRLQEASGIVASRQYPGVFWTHGDSGTMPALFAVQRSGEILAEVVLRDAPNTDWEDIAVDDAGNLYIGDIGNNTKFFPVRYIYRVKEPDPYHPPQAPIAPLERIRFKYPNGVRFNCESLFWYSGSLYLMPRQPGRTTIYRVQADDPQNAQLERVAEIALPSASAADVSADGRKLLICCSHTLTVIPLAPEPDWGDMQQAKRVRYPMGYGIEGACFDGPDVLLGAEDGALYRIEAKQIEAQERFHKPSPPAGN